MPVGSVLGKCKLQLRALEHVVKAQSLQLQLQDDWHRQLHGRVCTVGSRHQRLMQQKYWTCSIIASSVDLQAYLSTDKRRSWQCSDYTFAEVMSLAMELAIEGSKATMLSTFSNKIKLCVPLRLPDKPTCVNGNKN